MLQRQVHDHRLTLPRTPFEVQNSKQLQELQTRNARLDRLMAEGDTLSAEIQDNRLQMDSAYMRYFVWLGAAITLGLVAVHKAAK